MKNDDAQAFSEIFSATDECLPIDELIFRLEGHKGSEIRSSTETHLAACLRCEAELALYREFQSPEVREEEKPHVDAIVAVLRTNSPIPQASPWWKAIWNFKTLAPASLALASLIALLTWIPRVHEPEPGSFTKNDTLRSRRVEVLAPTGTVDVVPAILEWRPVKGAKTYRVRLFEVDNTELWQSVVPAASVKLPLDVRKEIVPLKTLEWQVTAIDPAGTSIAESGTQSFKLSR